MNERRWGIVRRFMEGPVIFRKIPFWPRPIKEHTPDEMEARRITALKNEAAARALRASPGSKKGEVR